MPKEPTIQIAVRIPTSMVKRLDELARGMAEASGTTYSRADMVRMALSNYLRECAEEQTDRDALPVVMTKMAMMSDHLGLKKKASTGRKRRK